MNFKLKVFSKMNYKNFVRLFCCLSISVLSLGFASAEAASGGDGGMLLSIGRSELVIVNNDISEIIVADPDVADVHVLGLRRVILIGKKVGRTNAKIFDKANGIIRQFDIVVGYDLPAIRKALHFFVPGERIAVELVNSNIALTGEVSDAASADKAMKIVNQFVGGGSSSGGAAAAAPAGAVASVGAAVGGAGATAGGSSSGVLNFLKISSGQQVMLRVRVGEVQRTALKNLGVSLSGVSRDGTIVGATTNKIGNFVTDSGLTWSGLTYNPDSAGVFNAALTSGNLGLSAALEALETQGLMKLLAEPNLVAISGEKAEFLAGGQYPYTVAQAGGAGAVNTVQFQNYGISVQFLPYVISQDKIRLVVQPEVSELDFTSIPAGTTQPAITTRKAKTTVELAPGESFMIAGLMTDRLNSSIKQIPGASEIPILGALLRSTAYKRGETELVIAITPYIVDPLKSSDVKMPGDDMRPASDMEMFFYGALGTLSGNAYRTSQTPSLEGPIGFVID